MTKIQPKLYLKRNNSWINKRVGLFKDIDLDESFGISKAIANLMYHLDTLLNTSQLKKTSEQSWKLEGTIQNSYNENIILTYEFDASSEKEAETLFESYKTMMKGKGIKILDGLLDDSQCKGEGRMRMSYDRNNEMRP